MRLFTVKRLLGALVLVCITISTNANANANANACGTDAARW